MGIGQRGAEMRGLAHAWILLWYRAGTQPASDSELRKMGRSPIYHDTEVAYLLKKFPWVFNRAQLSENAICMKTQKANTKNAYLKSVNNLVLDKLEL